MSNTRHAKPGAEFAPERYMSSAEHAGLNISLAIVTKQVRCYPTEARRAALWLANFAANSQRLQLVWQRRHLPDPIGTIGQITALQLEERLGIDQREIREVLTGGPDRNLPQFTAAVQAYRAKIEGALPRWVKTEDMRITEEAFAIATEDHEITGLIGKTRGGKTGESERLWVCHLDHILYVDTPESNDERSFMVAIAQAGGIGVGSNVKNCQLRQKIRQMLGIGLIDTLAFDEGHYLWPTDLADTKPQRLEFIRNCRDTLGVGSVIIATEQFSESAAVAEQENTRWAPGQFLGRWQPFRLRERKTKRELELIVSVHAGAIEPEAVAGLIDFAEKSEGYLGAMTNVIRLARRAAGQDGMITPALVAAKIQQHQTETKIVQIADGPKPKRRVRRTYSRRAA